jgi:hypothetical protein
MTRKVEAHGPEFLGQPFGGQPILDRHQARLGQILARVTKKRDLI